MGNSCIWVCLSYLAMDCIPATLFRHHSLVRFVLCCFFYSFVRCVFRVCICIYIYLWQFNDSPSRLFALYWLFSPFCWCVIRRISITFGWLVAVWIAAIYSENENVQLLWSATHSYSHTLSWKQLNIYIHNDEPPHFNLRFTASDYNNTPPHNE